MEMNQSTPGFSARRRWSGWINLLCASLAIVTLGVALNYYAHRHYQRHIWAQNLEHELSPRTEQLLGDMTNEVEITVFFDRTESTFRLVDELLKQYVHLNPRLQVTHVDPLQQPREARRVQARYRLSEQQHNVVVFASNDKHKVISGAQLSHLTPRKASANELQSAGQENTNEGGGFVMERTAFLGERHFTSALLAVSGNDQPLAYCLTGHGEHSITNLTSMGFGEFGQLLGEMNLQVRDLELQKQPTIPADCQLLIIPGPKSELTLEEQRRLNQYLDRGGRLMVLLNHRSDGGLSNLLRFWGLTVGHNTVLDQDNTLGDGSITLRQYVHHPVVQTLHREQLPVRLLLPRTISPLPGTDPLATKQKMYPLIQTGPQGKAYRNFLQSNAGTQPTLEHQGALPVAAAVERDTLEGVNTDHLARIVVIGDSLFLSNQMIDKEGNRELAWHTVNWLLDRSHLLHAIGPQPIQTYRFEFKANEFRNLAVILVGLMPLSTLTLGILVWLRRRT